MATGAGDGGGGGGAVVGGGGGGVVGGAAVVCAAAVVVGAGAGAVALSGMQSSSPTYSGVSWDAPFAASHSSTLAPDDSGKRFQ